MPKLKGPQDLPNESTPLVSKPDPWSGPWGKINPSSQSAQTLRLCKGASSTAEESFHTLTGACRPGSGVGNYKRKN